MLKLVLKPIDGKAVIRDTTEMERAVVFDASEETGIELSDLGFAGFGGIISLRRFSANHCYLDASAACGAVLDGHGPIRSHNGAAVRIGEIRFLTVRERVFALAIFTFYVE